MEDSYVLGLEESRDRLQFDLEVVLTENHPQYARPKPNEQYCYRRARLVFSRVRKVDWEEREFRPSVDADGEVDYGNIDIFYAEGDTYHLDRDWGTVRIVSDAPELTVG